MPPDLWRHWRINGDGALFIFWKAPLAIALSIALIDQLTKSIIVQYWDLGTHTVIIPGFFNIVHVRNPGAAWGIFAEHTFLLSLLSVAALAFIAFRFRTLADDSKVRAAAVSLIMGGVAGNSGDRIFRAETFLDGKVIDFLDFYHNSFHWPAFNVADSAICIGVFVYVLSSFLNPSHTPAKTETTPEP